MKFKRQIIAVLLLLIVVACGSAPASQHDMDITTADANTGTTYRAAINAALQALASTSAGATAPSPSYPNQPWADTTSGKFKLRNTANTAWITLFDLGTSLTVTNAELNAIPSQLAAKASLASPVFTTVGNNATDSFIIKNAATNDIILAVWANEVEVSELSTTALVIGALRKPVLDSPPASASASGAVGEIRITDSHIYLCTATNTWKRAALSSW